MKCLLASLTLIPSNSPLLPPGIIDVRYVAVLPYNVAAPRPQHPAGTAAPGANGCASDGASSDSDEEGRLERRDSVARGPEAQAYGALSCLAYLSLWACAAACLA